MLVNNNIDNTCIAYIYIHNYPKYISICVTMSVNRKGDSVSQYSLHNETSTQSCSATNNTTVQ